MNKFFKSLPEGVVLTLKIIAAGVIGLFLPVLLWNSWLLNYVDANGKLVPFILTPLFAFVATVFIMGYKESHKPAFIKGWINGFYGFLALFEIIEIVIVLLSNG